MFNLTSDGLWKDYGLSLESKVVSFDVYQRSSEKPVFRIIKNFNFYMKSKNIGLKKIATECSVAVKTVRMVLAA